MNQTFQRQIAGIAAAALIAIALTAPSAYARTPSSEAWTQPNESDLVTHGHYMNKSGQEVHSPAKTKSGRAPTGASAKCADGTYSFSKHHSGTCSRHGGVAEWE
ncbi:DUF3761 domain-containing protein [Paraburkholderia sediminicola]|uniref:DUF3761 domain-containing protein n=1 Tax=Paraburkholderia sediminicola TaxID=458836 RepID=UPI0038B7842E